VSAPRARWWIAGALAALVGAVGAVAAVRAPAGPAPPGTRLVRDAAGRFEISIPASWETRIAPPGRGAAALVASAPGAGDGAGPSVAVTVEALPRPMTAQEYAHAGMPLPGAAMSALRVLSEGPASVGGSPGYARTFTWISGNGTPTYTVQAYVVRGALGLIATGSTRNAPEAVSRDSGVLRGVVLSLRALGAAQAPRGAAAGDERVAAGRRDLFAAPPSAAEPSGSSQGGVTLPPVPSAGGVPLPPMPPTAPLLPPAPGSGAPPAPKPAPPLPRLAAVVLGPTPQAVLKGADGAYAIVRRSERTPWGTVAAIRASGVVLDTGSGTRTISWTGGSP